MVRKVDLSSPPTLLDSGLPYQWSKWLELLYTRVGSGPLKHQGYARTALPDVTKWGSVISTDPFTSTIFVYNATGGATLAFSDGTSWISCITGVAV